MKGANTFTYDGLQRLASVRQTSAVSDPPDASVTNELGETPYGYMTVVQPPSVGAPAVDTLAMSSDPMPGMEADFAYNADSQLLSADDYQSDSTDADAAMSIHVAHAAYGYDHASELTDLMYTDGSDNILAGYHWDYNSAGLVSDEYSWLDSNQDRPDASYTGTGSNWGKTTYSYDHDSQLTGTSYNANFASPPTSDVDVSYDANGNRTSTTDTGDSAVSAASSTDRVLFDGTYYYMYDAAGNRTLRYQSSDGKLDSSASNITGYEWNDRNELTAVDFFGSYANYSDHDNPSEVDYAYDALGHLVARSPDGLTGEQTEFYVYDGQNLALVLDAGGGVVESELYNPTAVNQVFASENASGVNWYLTDNQGTVRDVVQWTDAATENVDHLVYTPYGQIAWQSHAIDQPRFTYDGMPFDNDTQLSYDQARWYDAVDAVFASQDPLGFGGGDTNTERFCGNSPTNFTDPSGLFYWDWDTFWDSLGTGACNVAHGAAQPVVMAADGYYNAGRMVCGYDYQPVSDFGQYAQQRMNQGASAGQVYRETLPSMGANVVTFGGYGYYQGIQKYRQTGDPTQWQRAAGGLVWGIRPAAWALRLAGLTSRAAVGVIWPSGLTGGAVPIGEPPPPPPPPPPPEAPPSGTPPPPGGGVFKQPNIIGGLGPKGPTGAPYSKWIRLGPDGNGLNVGGKPLPGFDGGPLGPKPPGPFPPPMNPN